MPLAAWSFCQKHRREFVSVQSDSTVAPFGALCESDRRALQRWIAVAREVGVDDVQDLASRRWPATITGAVIGVFTPGDDQAAWLAIEQHGVWAVASCLDGSVSPPLDSLEEALAIVYRAVGASECI